RPRDGRDAILRMGRVLARLERLDRDLQAKAPHPILGTASPHAPIIDGGRELSSYPDACRLQLERRTIPGEGDAPIDAEVSRILDELRAEDPEFVAASRVTFARPPYELPADHPLPRTLGASAATRGRTAPLVGMSFWTDAAVLGSAGTPSILFGPGGAGLHSIEEYVNVEEVLACRDVLSQLAVDWCGGR